MMPEHFALLLLSTCNTCECDFDFSSGEKKLKMLHTKPGSKDDDDDDGGKRKND